MSISENPGESLPLTGKKVYSAGVIAVYTAVANIPVGCVLYGLNLCARGAKARGRLVVSIGIAGAIGLFSSVLFRDSPSRSLFLVSLFSAYCFYKFEKAPVKAALSDGAVLARWWPPALWLLGALAILIGVAFFFDL